MKKIEKILPRYAWLPLTAAVVLNILVYWGNRFITADMKHYDISNAIDEMIPFFSPMIIIYILSYVTWAIGFVVIGRESKEVCYEVMGGEMIAKLICLAFFIIMPTTMVRADVTGSGLFDELTRLIYSMDSPDNLFPSIHCLESWICFRGAMRCKKVGNGYRAFMFVFALLVFASTVLVKQHVFVDIIGGVAVVEIGLWLAKIIKGKIVKGNERKN